MQGTALLQSGFDMQAAQAYIDMKDMQVSLAKTDIGSVHSLACCHAWSPQVMTQADVAGRQAGTLLLLAFVGPLDLLLAGPGG